jgi:hypothetical protein
VSRLARWLRTASPGEIAQVATAILAFLATAAAAVAAVYTYKLGQRTEERLSSAVVEVVFPPSSADVSYERRGFAGAQLRLVISTTLAVRNLGGVAAPLTDVRFFVTHDSECLRKFERVQKLFISEPSRARIIPAGTARLVHVRRTYLRESVRLGCSRAASRLLNGANRDPGWALGAEVEFASGQRLRVVEGHTETERGI